VQFLLEQSKFKSCFNISFKVRPLDGVETGFPQRLQNDSFSVIYA